MAPSTSTAPSGYSLLRSRLVDIVAVIDILTPEHRYTAQHRERCIGLLEAAAHASTRLGHRIEGRVAPTAKPRS